MWSLGCITVVLLTGGSPFMSPRTNQYCQELAQACDLQQLDQVAEWQFVGKRPKDFVRQLLVLDEEQRMNAKDAKKHWWFSNNFHKLDFEDVYQRATKHWRPRTLKSPVIEMIDTNQPNELSMLQQSCLFAQRNHRRRSPMPVDPPYKPYPRKMSLSLLPKRRPGFAGVMPDEVRTAIRENWSPGRMRPPTVSPNEDEVPALMPDTEADELDRPGDETDPEDVSEKSAVRGARPYFISSSMSPSMPPIPPAISPSISPLRPLLRKKSSTAQKRTPKAEKASESSQVKAREREIVRRSSSANISSPAQSTERRSPQFGKTEMSLAIRGDAADAEETRWATRANEARVRTPRAGAEVVMLDGKGTFNQKQDETAREKSSRLPTHGMSYQPHKPAGEEALNMRDCRQMPCMPTYSSFEDVHPMAAESPFVHASLRSLERRNAPAKLRSPLHSVRTRSRRPSNMKRRRGSIYDLDSDEESEQAECGLASRGLDPEATDFRPQTAWKKTKRQID
jgi:serine/threonine protein kinase